MTGGVGFVRTDAEVAALVTPADYTYPPGDERRYGVKADYDPIINPLSDDTQALKDCYKACRAGNCDMKLMIRGTRRITEQLLWNAPVDVIGINREDVIIKLDVDAEQALYENFTVDDISGFGGGIDIWLGSRITIRRVICKNLKGHGILLRAGNLGTYQSIKCINNVNGGIVIASGTNPVLPAQSAWASTWTDIDCRDNGEYGFNITIGNSHFGLGVICQNNGLGGFRCAANTNVFQVYAENNPPGGPSYTDVLLTSSSVRNIITVNNAQNPTALQDNGTNNIVIDCALYPVLATPNVFPLSRSTNLAGNSLLVRGGFAGAGATGRAGGALNIEGGEAAGTSGAAAGGNVNIQGALGVNGGAKGAINLHDSAVLVTRATTAYSPSITPNLAVCTIVNLRPNNGTAFTINAPLNPRETQFWGLTIENVSGGVLGVIAFNAVFKMLAFTSPTAGKKATIWFYYDGVNHVQAFPQTINVPN